MDGRYRVLEDICSFVRCPRDYLRRVMEQLSELGVVDVLSDGNLEFVHGIRLLGKGQNSLVFKCMLSGVEGYFACKVRRFDATRPSLAREGENLKLANEVMVGPRLLKYSDDVLVMELVEGISFSDFIRLTEGVEVIRAVVLNALSQGFRLDSIGLVHGELSRVDEHLIVKGANVIIIDFESSTRGSSSSNVTQLTNALILGRGHVQERVRALLGIDDVGRVVNALKAYKKLRNIHAFNLVLNALNL